MRAAARSRRCGSGRPRLCWPRHLSVPCPWGVQRPGRTRGSRGPGRLLRGVRNAARDPARPRPGGSGRQPRGSRIGDVTWAPIVRGGLVRIERRRIPSRWARTARGGVDCVALGSHYASRDWPALAPARPGIGLRWPESRRGFGRGGGEGCSGVVLRMWGVGVVVVVCSCGSSSSGGLLRGRVSASSGCDAGWRRGRWCAGSAVMARSSRRRARRGSRSTGWHLHFEVQSYPDALGESGAGGIGGSGVGGGPGGGGSGAPAPAGRPAWWDGVLHVVTRPGSRARHLTRENVCQRYVLAG